MTANKLTINKTKTKYILFNPSNNRNYDQNLSIKIGGQLIKKSFLHSISRGQNSRNFIMETAHD